MTDDPDALTLALDRWSLSRPRPVADTATSRVYRVARADGSPAALKILKPHGADEILGAGLLAWYGGDGAARIFDCDAGTILMEWLDGALLGDRVRTGCDAEASAILGDVVMRLHAPRRQPPPTGLLPLRQSFAPLLDGGSDAFPASHRDLATRCVVHACALFDTAPPSIPLHGDLHHDNVLARRRGWLAVDPKGLIGDPAYEVANVFLNPPGATALVADAARIDRLADHFHARLGFDRGRLLAWAAAHVALSACWHHATGGDFSFSLKMLPLLVNAADRA